MIDRVDLKTIRQLAERTDGPWISICLPTERVGPNPSARIQFKNLVTEGGDLLTAKGTGKRDIAPLRLRATELLDDQPFWTNLDAGLAVFLSASSLETFRLGEPCDAAVHVGDQPQVDVLRHHAVADRQFAVLALSLHSVRLLRGNQHELIEDDPASLPTNMSAALDTDDREPQLQSHAGGRVGAGRTTASFHGHEGNADADVKRFMRLVDHALADAVAADLPVVLAGVDRTVASFRTVSRHRMLLDTSISGNADRTPAATLHEKAWSILQAAP